SASATLIVSDFSIAATPASQGVQRGGSTQYTTTITAQSGFSGVVSLNVNGLPQGATGSFNPATVTGSGSSTLTVSTLSTTPLGSYPLTISGTSGSLNHAVSATLVVNTTSSSQLAIDKVVWGDNTIASPGVTTSSFSTALPNELL